MPRYAIGDRRPTVHPTAWLAPSAVAIGDVMVGEEASLWFGAVARGDNTTIVIGARTNVQEGAMLHSDPGAPLTIGAGCTIGDGTLIGMGATVLNHASIGAESIVGANALVTEGKSFPPRSLIVGAPARSVKALDDAQVAMLRASAAHYVERAGRYARELVRLD